MHRIATCFGVIVTVTALAVANVVAQQAPSAAGPHLQPDAGDEEAAVKASGRRHHSAVLGPRATCG